jgi:TonB family protein
MKKAFIFIILFALQIFAQESEPKVVKAFAPDYPPAALAVGAKGEAKIEVEIDKDGNVVSAKGISGHPLLQASSISVAKKWIFEKSVKLTKPLKTTITFNYQGNNFVQIAESVKQEEKIVKSSINEESLYVNVSYEIQIPKLLLLPRENSVTIDKKCELHNQFMAVEIQDTSKQWDFFHDTDFYYGKFQKAEKKLFPNANLNLFLDDYEKEGIERIEVYYCQICRQKRKEWLEEKGIKVE